MCLDTWTSYGDYANKHTEQEEREYNARDSEEYFLTFNFSDAFNLGSTKVLI